MEFSRSMDLQYALLSPNGRLAPRPFGQGLVVLTGIMVVVQVLVALVSPFFDLAQYVLLYAYVCLFGKRLHDAGQSAWFYLAFLATHFVLTSLFSAMLLPYLSPEGFALHMELNDIISTQDMVAGVEFIAENQEAMARNSASTTIVSLLLSSGVLGLIGGKLKSDPDTNQYGPPTSGRI